MPLLILIPNTQQIHYRSPEPGLADFELPEGCLSDSSLHNVGDHESPQRRDALPFEEGRRLAEDHGEWACGLLRRLLVTVFLVVGTPRRWTW